MRISIALALVLCTAYLTPCQSAYPDQWPDDTDKIVVRQDLVYGTGGGRELRLTLISPRKGKGKAHSLLLFSFTAEDGGRVRHTISAGRQK